MTIRRGEVYRYDPVAVRPGMSRKRLVITADHLNERSGPPLSVGILVEDHDPGGLLAVPIGDQGWVSVVRIERLLPSRLTERLYVASPDELDQIATAMRAAFDL